MAPRIEIEAVLGTSGVRRGVSQISGQLGGVRKLASQTGSVFRGVLGANVIGKAGELGAAGLAKARDELTNVKEAGSALQQSTGAVDAVFGKYAAGIKKSAGQAEQALGLSRNEYQELTSVIGAGLKNKGLEDFAAQTQRVTGLGADLAAQYGGSTRQAVEAISSLMRGESDPIEQYGVSINETAVAAALAAKGQNKLTGAALEQAKARERLNLLFKQTTDAQGAFNREAGTYAGLEQRNAAAIENTRAKIGTALLPALTAGQKLLAEKILPVVNQAADAFGRELPGALATVQRVTGPILAELGNHVTRVGSVLQGMFAGGAGEGGPEQLIAKLAPLRDALSSLVAGASQLGTAVLPIVLQVGQALGQTLIDNAPAITQAGADLISIGQSLQAIWTQVGPVVIPIVQSVFGTIVQVISGAVTLIADILRSVSLLLQGDFAGAMDNSLAGAKRFAETMGTAVFGNIATQSKVMAQAVFKAFTGVEVDADRAWADFPANVGKIWNRIVTETAGVLTRFNRAVIGAFTGARDSAVSAVTGLRDRVVAGLTATRDRAAQQIDMTRLRVVSAVTGMVGSVGSQVAQVPGKVGAGFRAAHSAASSALTSLTGSVRTKINEAVTFVAGLPGRASSALSGMDGRLYSAGQNLVQGFINGMGSVIGSVAARARELAQSAVNAARSALGIASPSKVFAELGKFVGQGLARGVLGTRSQVDAAVKTLSSRMQAAFKEDATRAKTAAVAARTASVKKWQGEVREATQAQARIAANTKRIRTLNEGQLAKARAAIRANEARQAQLRAGGVTKKERAEYDRLRKALPGLDDRLAGYQKQKAALMAENDQLATNARALDRRAAKLKAAEAALAKARKVNTTDVAYRRAEAELRQQRQLIRSLQVNAAARERINAQLATERQRLAEMVKVREQYRQSVIDSARQFASITGIDAPKEGATVTAANLAQGLRDRLNAITNFRKRLEQLQKLGVNASTYEQIVAGGVEGGMDTLNALLSGGKTAVTEINRLQAMINSESGRLGTTAADRLYKAGIDAQRGLVAGLQADEAALDRAAARFASKLTAAVRRELGIRSPSRVFRTIAGQTVAGLIDGLDERAVARSGRDLARSLVDGFAQPDLKGKAELAAVGAAGSGVVQQITVEIRVDPTSDPVDLGRKLTSVLRQYQRAGGS